VRLRDGWSHLRQRPIGSPPPAARSRRPRENVVDTAHPVPNEHARPVSLWAGAMSRPASTATIRVTFEIAARGACARERVGFGGGAASRRFRRARERTARAFCTTVTEVASASTTDNPRTTTFRVSRREKKPSGPQQRAPRSGAGAIPHWAVRPSPSHAPCVMTMSDARQGDEHATARRASRALRGAPAPQEETPATPENSAVFATRSSVESYNARRSWSHVRPGAPRAVQQVEQAPDTSSSKPPQLDSPHAERVATR